MMPENSFFAMENIVICIESNMKVTWVCYQRSHASSGFQGKVLKVTKSYRKIIFTILYYIVICVDYILFRNARNRVTFNIIL